ncbi:Rieske (2Fe-2S) region [Methylophaga frappieri]|uniref:Rieske (2Fe-2S) region n=1 Tax=Methylophaga frappieri (strain ATCC BAA-2434 / DSM 25690 / JAM7) TaxID=754477 RepID=I1YHR0_METFJ|nr:Rieske (2Fe-2S) protein [Methylophaga frappieri]AFJ02453.1 Rieske (2Fe-2S) region [Methylophaga frappieri]
MTDHFYIGHAADLKENQAREFEITVDDSQMAGFVMRFEGVIYAYLNLCPHLRVPLNWKPDTFMSLEGTHIECSVHGALFNPDDGLCISGPCRGQSLTRLNIETDNKGDVYLVRHQQR